jgi:probable phosphoglycerate mutase
MSDTILFYLVRHGEAEHNVLGVGSCLPEITERHLTEKGKEQIQEVAETLAAKSIDALIASPLVRTQETAAIISLATGVPVQTDDRLHETGLGIFNEQPIRYFFEKYPDPALRTSVHDADGVESFESMRERLKSFLQDVRAHYTGKTVVVVSHGDPLEQLHGLLVGEGAAAAAVGWYPDKGSCTEIIWTC